MLGGSCNSPHACPIALANLEGKPDEMSGEVARQAHCGGRSTSRRARGLRRGAGWIQPLHVRSPTLVGFYLFCYHQQEFTILSSQMMF